MLVKIKQLTAGIQDELKKLSRDIFENPELGNEEHKACARHTEILQKHGFEVQTPFCGLDTAFKGVFQGSKPGPVIAFLAEYDALPGVGHGCGHNLLGTVSTGAGIVLKSIIEEVGGAVWVIGTPAEETDGAKVVMSEKGVFDKVDAAIIAHPWGKGYESSGTSQAMEAIQFAFKGKTAHAAGDPENGINALDAVIATFNNINALREHLPDSIRVHGIISNGGKAANIVPDYAEARFYVRAPELKLLRQVKEKVLNCAHAGALATGATLSVSNYEASFHNLVTNKTLSEEFTHHLTDQGCVVKPRDQGFGSTDMGNVSHRCPAIHPYFDISNGKKINGHSLELAQATQTPYAFEQAMKTICACVLTAIKVITDPSFLEKVKHEFTQSKK